MKLLDNLRRLLAPRTPTQAENAGEPTADRPPPPVVAETEPAPPERVPSEELQELREALEAVADTPVPETQPTAEIPPPAVEAPSIVSPPPIVSTPPSVAPPPPTPVSHGDALVLTLATPAATFTIAKTAATIGRGQENVVRLDDLSVSRRHARIAYRQGGYWLSDLGSMGGTWVDGTRLNAPLRLTAGQVIDIGLCRLTVSAAGVAKDAGIAQKAVGKKSASGPRSEMAAQSRRRR